MKKFVYSAVSFLFPVVAFAQTLNFEQLNTPITGLGNIINRLIPLIIGAAVLVFLWGVLKYVISGDNEEKRADAKWFMIWGIVALFVMVSVWGLVRILQNTLGVSSSSGAPGFPQVPGSN